MSQINDTFVTVHIKWPKIQPSTSMHFATRLRRSHVFRQNSSWCFYCGQQHPKCEPSIRLVQPLLFCKLYSSSNPINKNSKVVRCGDSHICVSITFQNWIHGFFFLTVTGRNSFFLLIPMYCLHCISPHINLNLLPHKRQAISPTTPLTFPLPQFSKQPAVSCDVVNIAYQCQCMEIPPCFMHIWQHCSE